MNERFLACVECDSHFDGDRRLPYLLPCLHATCVSCLKTHSNKGSVNCRECQETFSLEKDGIQTFKVDNTRKHLSCIHRLQTNKSDIPCDQCGHGSSGRCAECEEYLCDDCTEAHTKTKLTKRHNLIPLGSLNSSSKGNAFRQTKTCEVPGHDGQKMSFFCNSKNCHRPICTICMLKNHVQENGHDVRNIHDVYDENRRLLEGYVVDMRYLRQRTDENIDTVQNKKEELKNKTQKVEDELETYFQICMQSLERRKSELKEKLRKTYDTADKALQRQTDNLRRQKERIEFTTQTGQDELDYGSETDFIGINNVIISRMKELEVQADKTKTSDYVVDVKFIPKHMEEFAARVQKFGDVWFSSDEMSDTNDVSGDNKLFTTGKRIQRINHYGKRPLRLRTTTIDTDKTVSGTDDNDDELTIADADLSQGTQGEIACPDFTFDTSTTHVQNCVSENGKSLSNQKPRRHFIRSLNHAFTNYRGTVGTLPLGKHIQYYFEVHVNLFIKRQLRQDLMFEIGLSRKSIIDKNYTIDCHPYSWVVCARKCSLCRSVCLMAWHNNMKLCHQPIADCPPGTSHKAVYGFLLNTRYKQWVVMDAKSRKYLFRFRNVDVSKPLWPTFGVYNPDLVDVTLSLRSGKDIKTALEVPFED